LSDSWSGAANCTSHDSALAASGGMSAEGIWHVPAQGSTDAHARARNGMTTCVLLKMNRISGESCCAPAGCVAHGLFDSAQGVCS
jgi:hypothetical protein